MIIINLNLATLVNICFVLMINTCVGFILFNENKAHTAFQESVNGRKTNEIETTAPRSETKILNSSTYLSEEENIFLRYSPKYSLTEELARINEESTFECPMTMMKSVKTPLDDNRKAYQYFPVSLSSSSSGYETTVGKTSEPQWKSICLSLPDATFLSRTSQVYSIRNDPLHLLTTGALNGRIEKGNVPFVETSQTCDGQNDKFVQETNTHSWQDTEKNIIFRKNLGRSADHTDRNLIITCPNKRNKNKEYAVKRQNNYHDENFIGHSIKRVNNKEQVQENWCNSNSIPITKKRKLDMHHKDDEYPSTGAPQCMRHRTIILFLRDQGVQTIGNTFGLIRSINDEFNLIDINLDKFFFGGLYGSPLKQILKGAFQICKAQVVMVFFGSLRMIVQNSAGSVGLDQVVTEGWHFLKQYVKIWQSSSLSDLINFSERVDETTPIEWRILHDARHFNSEKYMKAYCNIILLNLWYEKSLLEKGNWSIHLKPQGFFNLCETTYQKFQRGWTTKLSGKRAIGSSQPRQNNICAVLRQHLDIPKENATVTSHFKKNLLCTGEKIVEKNLPIDDFARTLLTDLICVYLQVGDNPDLVKCHPCEVDIQKTRLFSNEKMSYMLQNSVIIATEYVTPGVFAVLKKIHDHQRKQWDFMFIVQHVWSYLQKYFCQWLRKEFTGVQERSLFQKQVKASRKVPTDWSNPRESFQHALEQKTLKGIPHMGVLYLCQQWYILFIEYKRQRGDHELDYELSPFHNADVYKMYARDELERVFPET